MKAIKVDEGLGELDYSVCVTEDGTNEISFVEEGGDETPSTQDGSTPAAGTGKGEEKVIEKISSE